MSSRGAVDVVAASCADTFATSSQYHQATYMELSKKANLNLKRNLIRSNPVVHSSRFRSRARTAGTLAFLANTLRLITSTATLRLIGSSNGCLLLRTAVACALARLTSTLRVVASAAAYRLIGTRDRCLGILGALLARVAVAGARCALARGRRGATLTG